MLPQPEAAEADPRSGGDPSQQTVDLEIPQCFTSFKYTFSIHVDDLLW